jgi:hypothetical protein
MQDQRYDEIREMLGANAEKGIDERFKELIRNDSDELEELMEREYLREDLQPKYVIVRHGALFEFRARYVDMHRTLLSSEEISHGRCDGGGFWGVNGEKRMVTLYDSSSDFGFPKHIEDAIYMDGWHLLEILGRVCDKSGEHHDLTGYQITYMDRQHERHFVDYLSREQFVALQLEAGRRDDIGANANFREWEDAPQARLSREDYERFGRCTNYTPPSPVNKKKRKAKAKAQKQSRKKNRKH